MLKLNDRIKNSLTRLNHILIHVPITNHEVDV